MLGNLISWIFNVNPVITPMEAAARQASSRAEMERCEANAFLRCIEDLPKDEREKAQERFFDRKSKRLDREREDRKHKELCESIRSTGFWRF